MREDHTRPVAKKRIQFASHTKAKIVFAVQLRTSGGSRTVVGFSGGKASTLSDFSAELGIGHVVRVVVKM